MCKECETCENIKKLKTLSGKPMCVADNRTLCIDEHIERCPWPSKRVEKKKNTDKDLKNLADYISGCYVIECPTETKLKMLKEAKKCLCKIIENLM